MLPSQAGPVGILMNVVDGRGKVIFGFDSRCPDVSFPTRRQQVVSRPVVREQMIAVGVELHRRLRPEVRGDANDRQGRGLDDPLDVIGTNRLGVDRAIMLDLGDAESFADRYGLFFGESDGLVSHGAPGREAEFDIVRLARE